MSLASDILKNQIGIKIKARGVSMLPFIRSGDYVVIRPAVFAEVRIGDILAYSYNSGPIICHRLLKIRNTELITKGDTHIFGYERISYKGLLGKVVLVERGRKKFHLESGFQKSLSHKIAKISYNLPLLFFLFICLFEALRAPYLLPQRIIRFFYR